MKEDLPLPLPLRRPVVAALIAWLSFYALAGLVRDLTGGTGEDVRVQVSAGLAAITTLALRVRAARSLRAAGLVAPRAASGALFAALIGLMLLAGAGAIAAAIHRATLPEAARVESIETRFGPAIDRLATLARDPEAFRRTVERTTEPPFSDPAVIEAVIWRQHSRDGRALQIVYDDGRRDKAGRTWFPRRVRESGDRVTNVWTSEGSRQVEYDRAVTRNQGKLHGFTLLLDLDALEASP